MLVGKGICTANLRWKPWSTCTYKHWTSPIVVVEKNKQHISDVCRPSGCSSDSSDPLKRFCCPGVEHGQHDLYPDVAQAPGKRDGSGCVQGTPLLRGRRQHRQGSARLCLQTCFIAPASSWLPFFLLFPVSLSPHPPPNPFMSSFTTRKSLLSGLVVKGSSLLSFSLSSFSLSLCLSLIGVDVLRRLFGPFESSRL